MRNTHGVVAPRCLFRLIVLLAAQIALPCAQLVHSSYALNLQDISFQKYMMRAMDAISTAIYKETPATAGVLNNQIIVSIRSDDGYRRTSY
jgi:hypothetical protein